MEKMLSNYRITHEMKEPSKVSDYDYDPYNRNRRFISTYLHELKFYDRFMDTPIITLGFASEICADIISTLYNMANIISDKHFMIQKPMRNPVVSTILNVYVDENIYPTRIVFTKLDSYIKLAIANYEEYVELMLTFEDAKDLVELLDSEELANMYVLNSNDIDER